MQKNLGVIAAMVVSVVAGSACASKGFVRTEVGDVNTKVNALGTSLEATQERTRQNEARIGEVDTKADGATRSAVEARAVGDAAVVRPRTSTPSCPAASTAWRPRRGGSSSR